MTGSRSSIFMLAAFTGYEVIARVPVILQRPLMSGSNFVSWASCSLRHGGWAALTRAQRRRLHWRVAGSG